MRAHLRVARPTDDLEAVTTFYRDGLGFEVIGGFGGNGTIDGVMLGHPEYDYHPEFTYHHDHEAGGEPSDEHLLVFYLPDRERWDEAVHHLRACGHESVRSSNPYREVRGATFEDPDGYRIVLENAEWSPAVDPTDDESAEQHTSGVCYCLRENSLLARSHWLSSLRLGSTDRYVPLGDGRYVFTTYTRSKGSVERSMRPL